MATPTTFKKISDLSAATLPLAGTELLELQTAAGASAKATVQDVANLALAAKAYDWIIALGDETTAITAGTAKVTIRAPRAMTLSKVKASLTMAGTGTSTFDVKLNGASVFSTTLTIDASEKTSETATTAAVLSTTAIAADDELTFDIVTAGGSAAGAKITLVGTV